MPKAPTIPASLAALVTLVGLGLIYWSLTNLGLLTVSGASPVASSGPTGIGKGPLGSAGNPVIGPPTGSFTTGTINPVTGKPYVTKP